MDYCSPIPIGKYTNITAEEHGGKAFSLQKLIKAGFRVPTAWVIPCKYSVSRPRIELIESLDKSMLYSVRSGAPISMPGLLHTSLNIAYTGLIKHTKRVWDSWNSEQAKLYREAHNIDNSIGTGVIYQKMVPDIKYSGVVFTSDPNDFKNKSKFNPVIEFVEGVGESLVSGEVTPKKANDMPWYESLRSLVSIIHDNWGPSDIEFSISEDGIIWFLQQRALKFADIPEIYKSPEGLELLEIGESIGAPKVSHGTVKLINDFSPGDILYLSEFNPKYYGSMIKSKAIISSYGGSTCHASIVAREIGIPAVSGIKWGLVGNKEVTVDGVKGSVFLGKTKNETIDLTTTVTKTLPPVPNLTLSKHLKLNAEEILILTYVTKDLYDKGEITKEIYDANIGELAYILSAYFYLICCGEARHIHNHSGYNGSYNEVFATQLQENGIKIPPKGVSVQRETFIAGYILQPINIQMAAKAMEVVTKCFYQGAWSSSYGGKKWGVIAEILLNYLKGDFTPILFIDAIMNCQHNNGRAFGKTDFITYDGSSMNQLLDNKAGKNGNTIYTATFLWNPKIYITRCKEGKMYLYDNPKLKAIEEIPAIGNYEPPAEYKSTTKPKIANSTFTFNLDTLLNESVKPVLPQLNLSADELSKLSSEIKHEVTVNAAIKVVEDYITTQQAKIGTAKFDKWVVAGVTKKAKEENWYDFIVTPPLYLVKSFDSTCECGNCQGARKYLEDNYLNKKNSVEKGANA